MDQKIIESIQQRFTECLSPINGGTILTHAEVIGICVALLDLDKRLLTIEDARAVKRKTDRGV